MGSCDFPWYHGFFKGSFATLGIRNIYGVLHLHLGMRGKYAFL